MGKSWMQGDNKYAYQGGICHPATIVKKLGGGKTTDDVEQFFPENLRGPVGASFTRASGKTFTGRNVGFGGFAVTVRKGGALEILYNSWSMNTEVLHEFHEGTGTSD